MERALVAGDSSGRGRIKCECGRGAREWDEDSPNGGWYGMGDDPSTHDATLPSEGLSGEEDGRLTSPLPLAPRPCPSLLPLSLIRTSVILTMICCYLMWSIIYLAQLHPLISE